MVAISNVGIDAILLGVRNRGAAVIACIGRHFCLLKHVGGDLCGLEPFARALEHGLKQMRLLPFPMGLGVHDDLMFLIDHSHPVVALDHPVAGRHLGALGIGDVTLTLVTTGTHVFRVGF